MSYSCNDNQNYFVSETGRTTSRVLNPPGGASNFSLGGSDSSYRLGEAPSSSSPAAASSTTSFEKADLAAPSVAGHESEATKPAASPAATETKVPAPAAAAPSPSVLLPAEDQQHQPPHQRPVSSNAFASGANMNGANVMTGRPTSRVLAPPGGHSALGGSLW